MMAIPEDLRTAELLSKCTAGENSPAVLTADTTCAVAANSRAELALLLWAPLFL
jgi:hypothetical protein